MHPDQALILENILRGGEASSIAHDIFFSGDRTSRLAIALDRQIEAEAMAAHPADVSGGIADHERIGRHIADDHRTGPDKRILSDGDAAHDGGVGAKGGAFFHQGSAKFVHAFDFTPGIKHIGEDHGGSTEYVVFEGDALVDGDIVLDLAVVADGDLGSDDHVLADLAGFTEGGAFEQVAEVPDFASLADGDSRVDFGGGVGKKRWFDGGGRGHRDRLVRLKGLLTGIQDAKNPQALAAIRARRGSGLNAMKKVRAFGAQGLLLR